MDDLESFAVQRIVSKQAEVFHLESLLEFLLYGCSFRHEDPSNEYIINIEGYDRLTIRFVTDVQERVILAQKEL